MPHRKYLRIALLICLGLIAAGLYSFAADEKEKPGTPAPNAKARRDAARKVYEMAKQAHLQGLEGVRADSGYFHDWSVRWLQAERDLSQKKPDDVTALEEHLKRMEFWKDLIDSAVKDGQATKLDASAAEFFRLEAEDWLAAARAEGK